MGNPLTNAARLAHAGFVLARYDALMPPEQLALAPWPLRAILKVAKLGRSGEVTGGEQNRLTTALSRLGPSYIKLGQFLATRPDVIGAKRAFELKALQDRLPPFADADARRIVESELGKPIADLFSFFGPAIAAASIAQVHKCVTRDGRRVAVKILRPGVERRFANDIASFAFAARLAERISPEGKRLRPVDAVAMLKDSMNL
ncbi:MAG: ubiquinone biosynthesis protein UbiB, partial [Alphaproteobacteria bacterium]|nr:ubiquinone biosynthesis protein UbiB [Alphaproteobacteria bacterium]